MEETGLAPARVTVLIVARNCVERLRRCLAALEASTARERLDIVVADNGSTDSSGQVDAEFPAVTVFRIPKNVGFTRAANIGMRGSKSDFVFFLPPGVEVAPDTIEQLAARLEENERAAAVCPALERTWPLPDRAALDAFWKTGDLPGARPLSPAGEPIAIDYPGREPLLARRSFLEGMNYLDQRRFGEHWADADLCRQIRFASRRILVFPEIRVTSRQASDSALDAIESADAALGGAAYLAKHSGFAAGLKFRIRAILYSLGRLLTFRGPGYEFGRLSALISGQKIDGNQE